MSDANPSGSAIFVPVTPTPNASQVVATILLDPVSLISIVLCRQDPSSVGIVAPIGSMALKTDGSLFTKTGAGATAWTAVLGGASGGISYDPVTQQLVFLTQLDDSFLDFEVANTAGDGGANLGLNATPPSASMSLSDGADNAQVHLDKAVGIDINTTKAIRLRPATLGFFDGVGIAKPTVSGSKGANAALASLMTALAAYGLVIDSTT